MDNQIELFKEQEITTQDIQSLIVKLPNRPSAMLASALAEIYGTETRRINEAVDRNKDRFPEDFYFQATDEEKRFLMSQSAMSKKAQAAITELNFQLSDYKDASGNQTQCMNWIL